MEIIPFYDSEAKEVRDGDVVQAARWCHKNFNATCRGHYDRIRKSPGFHICPYGFTTLTRPMGTTEVIYTSSRVAGHVDQKKLSPKLKGDNRIRSFSEDDFLAVVENSIAYNNRSNALAEEIAHLRATIETERKKTKESNDVVNATLHEIRSLNRTMKSQAEDVLGTLKQYVIRDENDFFTYRINNINATSNLISTRIAAFDVLNNPVVAEMSARKSISPHNKFFKCKQILNTYFKDTHITIHLSGESYSRIEAGDLFDLLPYVIYENFVKYAPAETVIDTVFSESTDRITVVVSGTGPKLTDGEEVAIFEKYVRGRNAEALGKGGSGLGLYLAETICQLYDIEIAATSVPPYSALNGVAHAVFRLSISMPISERLDRP